MFKGMDLGIEAVDHLKDSKLAANLLKEIKNIREKRPGKSGNLSDIMSHFTRGNIKVQMVKGHRASIRPEILIRNNPLWDYRNHLLPDHKLADIGKIIDIGVNLETSTFTGKPKDFPFIIKLGKEFTSSKSKFTPEETVAVLLHELGHAFSYVEYMGYTYVNNFLLDDFAERIVGTRDKDRRYAMIKDVADGTGRPALVDDAIREVKTVEQAQLIIVSGIAKETRVGQATNAYTWRNWEALADQFVTRHGYGRALATALNKNYQDASKAIAVLQTTIVNVIEISVTVLGILRILFVDVNDNDEYDSPKRRLEVIRNQQISRLREDWVTKEDRDQLLEDIDHMDELIGNAPPQFLSLLGFISEYIMPWKIHRRRDIETQKLLEDFASSDLNVAARRLEQLRG